MNKKVLMIVRTSVIHDSRVLREAATLSGGGYSVTIIGMKDSGDEPSNLDINGVAVHLVNLSLKNILPISMIGWVFKYFEFVVKVIIKGLGKKADIIHCHDLDGLLPGYLLRFFRLPDVPAPDISEPNPHQQCNSRQISFAIQ